MIEPVHNERGEKRRVRVKVRSRKSDREKKKITRLQVVSILLAAVIGGVVLGLLLGRFLNKALMIHRNDTRVSVVYSSTPALQYESSGTGPVPDSAPSPFSSGSGN